MVKSIVCKIYAFLSLILLLSLMEGGLGLEGKKTWTYELVSITTETSDSEKFKWDLEVERISRGVYAISGTMLINFDIVEGDYNNISAKMFRSAQGDGDYKVLPLQVPEDHFFKILNTYYKNILMETMKDCSTMPTFKDKFQPPLEKKVYTFDACQFSQDGFPNHLEDGLYKIAIVGNGEVDWLIEVIAEVTRNI